MDKPPVIEETREVQKKKIPIYNLLILAIAAGALIYQGFILREMRGTEGIAWDREGSFYRKIREKDLARLAILSQKLEDLNNDRAKIEGRLGALLKEKEALEKEKKEFLKNIQQAEVRAKESLIKKEQELKASLSKEYESEISGLKKTISELEKLKKELQGKKGAEELERKNRDLLESLIKANQSNEYLMKKIEDLKKVRNELEEELRRGKKGTSSSW